MKKQHGIDIDPNNPNVEVISLLDVEKSIDIITTAIKGLSAKMTSASSTASSCSNKRSIKKSPAKKLVNTHKKALKKVQLKKV
jgi:hypothetical protein